MEVLVFPNAGALSIAMRSGLVPGDLQAERAKVGSTSTGEMEVNVGARLGPKPRKALQAAGVEFRAASVPLRDVSCWAEALPLLHVGEPQGELHQVLFTVSGAASLLELASELLRLGCDRQDLSMVTSSHAHALVKVVDPPWFVLSRALDGLDGLRAFVPISLGQDRLWSELTWAHPLADSLEAPDSGLVLMTKEGLWWRLDEGEWLDLDQLLIPSGLKPAAVVNPRLDAPKVEVTLSLVRAARPEAPSLFVVPEGQAAVEALVRSTPEAQLENLLFVVSDRLVVLRTRPGREAHGDALPGEAYARVLDMANLFAPASLTVEPPLRRNRLREWLAPDPDLITWLEPTEKGFSRRSVPESAFRPLTEWVDYVIDGATQTLETWARSATFDFEPFVALEDAQPAPRSETLAEPEAPRAKPRRPKESRAAAREASAAQVERDGSAQGAGAGLAGVDLPSSLSEAEVVVTNAESAFLDLDAPADSSARRAAWVRLAEMYSKVQRPRDAGMAWAHALWEAEGEEALRLARRWADTSGVRFEAALAVTAPNVEQTRGTVAHLLAAALERNATVAARVTDWVGFLDRFNEDLDVRSHWLGRFAVSRLSGGDSLGLARARDRVLARVQSGLSMDRDVPRLLRVMGQANAAGAGTGRALRVSAQLESLLQAFEETPRKRTAVEAPTQLTHAYVSLEFAWAFARLANPERARQLRDRALTALDRNDAVHHYLTQAYVSRIEQALEGVSPLTPLPAAVNVVLTGLESFDRYKVDRLRQFSQVLEPQERLEAISAFGRNMRDPRGEELGALRSVRDPSDLYKAIETRMGAAGDANLPVEERARLIDGLLDYLPQLPESQALPLLQRFLTMGDGFPAKQRAIVLEDALKIAGHFGRTAVVKQLVSQLGNAIKEVGSEGVGEIGGLLVSGVRSLRRVGLRDEAGELLARASTVLKGEDVQTLQARLGLASGFMYLGAYAQAQPIVDEAMARLGRESGLIMAERMKLSRATAQAVSHASTDLALTGLLRLSKQLPWITDSYNTNGTPGPDGKPRHHFCLSLVDFADSLVLGHVGDDLTLNETTRRFLDEDEYLVRRRVHRDVGGAS
jgi:cellulose synthase operon protein C